MQGFADFADGLLGGAILVALAIAVGGVAWGFLVLAPAERDAGAAPGRRCLDLVGAGALALAMLQATSLALKTVVLLGYVGQQAAWDVGRAAWFRGGVARVLLALALCAVAWWPAARDSSRQWRLAGVVAALVLGSGAWLVHAVGRLEHRGLLMLATVLHQAAAVVWVGGLVQLGAYARLARSNDAASARWPAVVARFSRVAVGAVVAVLVTALPLGWTYVGSLDALVGTAYGSLVVTKVALMAIALVLGALNFRAARAVDATSSTAAVRRHVPGLAEAETLVLAILLFAAATLASQPPAVDVTTERATVSEMVEVFRPKWPTFRTPSLADKRQVVSDPFAVVGGERKPTAYQWSNFTHNVAGMIVAAMAMLALVAATGHARWARHWPVGLVALAIFVWLRASASEGVWPFGPEPFWFVDAEGFQHRIGALLALGLGAMEWRARAAPRPGSVLPYVFPALATAGGVLLLTHAHAAFELKSSYLVQVTHSTMGALAVLIACGRWMELRLAPPGGRVAGTLSHVAMLLLALVLVFYREANVIVPVE